MVAGKRHTVEDAQRAIGPTSLSRSMEAGENDPSAVTGPADRIEVLEKRIISVGELLGRGLAGAQDRLLKCEEEIAKLQSLVPLIEAILDRDEKPQLVGGATGETAKRQNLSREKPWEKEGMSRANWYKRRREENGG